MVFESSFKAQSRMEFGPIDFDILILEGFFPLHLAWCNDEFVLDWVMVLSKPVIILYEAIFGQKLFLFWK